MVKNNNKKPTYEEYFNTLIPLSLNIFPEEQLKSFKKTKGMGQFILNSNINNEPINERWDFYRFEEGTNFNNFTKDSRIYCRPVYADKENNFIDILYYHKGKLFVKYRGMEDAKININYDDEKYYNQFQIVDSTIPSNLNLKIGMYLQTGTFKNMSEFEKAMNLIVDEDFDILVFPETCYTPFTVNFKAKSIFNIKNQDEIIDYCLELSKSVDKAVVVSSMDENRVLFSVYANANASDNETHSRIYIKHTMTDNSAFIDEDYEKYIETLFTPIKYKDYLIGLTICYDCNHAPFSRMYGLQNVDVIINSTGGDVVYDKWYKYNKARAIENQCYNFVTMGGWQKNKNFTYGFNPRGRLILPVNMDDKKKPLEPGKVYIYDLSNCSLDSKAEHSINQKTSINKKIDFEIMAGNSDEILSKSEKIKENIYVYDTGKFNVIFCIVNGNDILKPEKVLSLLYDSSLSNIGNKKYIIINRHDNIDEKFYSDYLSIILKVRTMENFCAVLLESNNINKCYQVSCSKTLQVVKPENNKYGIDLNRTGGPEAIWENKNGMRKIWRKNFEKLIEFMVVNN